MLDTLPFTLPNRIDDQLINVADSIVPIFRVQGRYFSNGWTGTNSIVFSRFGIDSYRKLVQHIVKLKMSSAGVIIKDSLDIRIILQPLAFYLVFWSRSHDCVASWYLMIEVEDKLSTDSYQLIFERTPEKQQRIFEHRCREEAPHSRG